jgi:hypothetical protein
MSEPGVVAEYYGSN